MEPTLRSQLITKFHLENLPAEEAESALEDAGVVVMTGVITRAIPLLDEAATIKCDALLERDAELGEIFMLLKENVPSFQNIVDEEIDSLEKTLQ